MSRSQITPGDGDPRHGTLNGYGNLGCRCVPCKTAHTAEMAQWRADTLARPIPDHVHGTNNGYTNYGCRCTPCKAAHTEMQRDKRARARRNAARSAQGREASS